MPTRLIGKRERRVRYSGEADYALVKQIRQADDRQSQHEIFEATVGIDRGFRLMRIWETAGYSASGNCFTLDKRPSREEYFFRYAERDGYSYEECLAYLALR